MHFFSWSNPFNEPASRSAAPTAVGSVVGLGHDGEPARAGLEVRTPALLVGGGADQRGEGTLDQIRPLHRPDPDKRVRHGGPPHVEPPRGRRDAPAVAVGVVPGVLVESAAEGTRVGRRRAHARPPLRRRRRTDRLLHDPVVPGGDVE